MKQIILPSSQPLLLYNLVSSSSSSRQAAALDIAMIKMVTPSMAYRVIDRAIQVSAAGWFELLAAEANLPHLWPTLVHPNSFPELPGQYHGVVLFLFKATL